MRNLFVFRDAPKNVHPVLASVSRGYPRAEGRLLTCYSPVRRSADRPEADASLDLHVLSTPPAFVLSQDQTLHRGITSARRAMPECVKARDAWSLSQDAIGFSRNGALRCRSRTGPVMDHRSRSYGTSVLPPGAWRYRVVGLGSGSSTIADARRAGLSGGRTPPKFHPFGGSPEAPGWPALQPRSALLILGGLSVSSKHRAGSSQARARPSTAWTLRLLDAATRFDLLRPA